MAIPPPLPIPAPAKPAPRVSDELAQSVVEQLWFGDPDPERTLSEASGSFAAALGRSLALKPFPKTASEAMGLLAHPETPVERVTRVLEHDLALSSRLLQVANSVIFAGRSPCATVSEAVVRLGFRQTGQLVLSAAALGMFEDAAGVASVVRDHCVAVAAMTHTLATEWGSQCLDTAFAAGLLSDVGKLFALQSKELNYEASPSVLEVPDRVHVMERMIVGWDHAVLGGHLLHYWQLPAEIGRAVAWHHQPGRAYQEGGSVGLTVALMRLANSVEYQLRKNPELDEDFADELARSGEASYASLSRDILVAMWPKLAQARRDALTSL